MGVGGEKTLLFSFCFQVTLIFILVSSCQLVLKLWKIGLVY